MYYLKRKKNILKLYFSKLNLHIIILTYFQTTQIKQNYKKMGEKIYFLDFLNKIFVHEL